MDLKLSCGRVTNSLIPLAKSIQDEPILKYAYSSCIIPIGIVMHRCNLDYKEI